MIPSGELSVGRQQAFEIFKRDYAENGKISAQKEKLKANFRSAKDLGEKVNSTRETINRLKAQIEHYRVSLAMSMGMSSSPNDEPPDETETLVRWGNHSFIRTFVRSFIPLFNQSINQPTKSALNGGNRLYVRSFIHPFIQSINQLNLL